MIAMSINGLPLFDTGLILQSLLFRFPSLPLDLCLAAESDVCVIHSPGLMNDSIHYPVVKGVTPLYYIAADKSASF